MGGTDDSGDTEDEYDYADDDDWGQDETGEPEPQLKPTEISPELAKAIEAEWERMKQRRPKD